MGAAELRKELHNYIDHADETFLKMVYAMSKEYKSSGVVGYNVDGSPISQEDLKKRVKAASKRVKAGNYITQEDLEKEVENW
jgi:hypothetical protein